MRGGRRDLQNQREQPPQEREPDAGGERKWESELRLPEAVLLEQQNRCSVPNAAAAPPRWGVGRLEGSRTPCRAAHTGRPEGTHRDCRHPEAGFPALPPRPIPPRPGSTSLPAPPPLPPPARGRRDTARPAPSLPAPQLPRQPRTRPPLAPAGLLPSQRWRAGGERSGASCHGLATQCQPQAEKLLQGELHSSGLRGTGATWPRS